jgi:hypothetical protein
VISSRNWLILATTHKPGSISLLIDLHVLCMKELFHICFLAHLSQVSFYDHLLSVVVVVREHGTFCNCCGYWPETLYICTPRSYDLPDQVSFRFDSWLGHQGAKTENTKSGINYNSWTNDWIILKFLSEVYLVRIHDIHDIIHRFLIWPPFEGHRGKRSKWHRCWHVSLLFDLEHSNLVWTCI